MGIEFKLSLKDYDMLDDKCTIILNGLVYMKFISSEAAENSLSDIIPECCRAIIKAGGTDKVDNTTYMDIIYDSIIKHNSAKCLCDCVTKEDITLAITYETLYKVALLYILGNTPERISEKLGIELSEIEYAINIAKNCGALPKTSILDLMGDDCFDAE